MGRYRALVLLLLVAILTAGPSTDAALPEAAVGRRPSAVDTPHVLASLLPMRTAAGSWAEYVVRSRGAQDFRVRVCVVPPALEAGRAWIEVTALGETALPFAARLLLRNGRGVERVLLSVLGQAPLDFPIEPAEPAAARGQQKPRRIRAVTLGGADVSVPAGRFHAEDIRIAARGEALHAWRSDLVPLWGLVRAEGPRQVIELVAYGHNGGRSVFPEGHGNGSDSTK
jgi:hypothetical protein